MLMMQELHEHLSGVTKSRRELGDRDLGDTVGLQTLQLHVAVNGHGEVSIVEGVIGNRNAVRISINTGEREVVWMLGAASKDG